MFSSCYTQFRVSGAAPQTSFLHLFFYYGFVVKRNHSKYLKLLSSRNKWFTSMIKFIYDVIKFLAGYEKRLSVEGCDIVCAENFSNFFVIVHYSFLLKSNRRKSHCHIKVKHENYHCPMEELLDLPHTAQNI